MKYNLSRLETAIETGPFELGNLILESRALKSNQLGDSLRKHNYVLAPKNAKKVPLVFHLAGYFANGFQSFNLKTLEENYPQQIVRATIEKKIPMAVHVFVDAMTAIGGSQFIASETCGDYETYLQKELLVAIDEEFAVSTRPQERCILGASSGGYGALHHISLEKTGFGVAVAIAPDSHFESSLLPELYKMAPYLEEWNQLSRIRAGLKDGRLQSSKHFFHLMNSLAMTLCYSSVEKGRLLFPIDLKTGELREDVWKKWLEKDPVHFLAKRADAIKKRMIYLDVGQYDEFSLYFGARRIQQVLKTKHVPHVYEEFAGGHFSLNERKLRALQWLKKYWT